MADASSPVGAAMAGAFTIDSIDAHDGTTPNKGHVRSAVFPRCFWRWRIAGARWAGKVYEARTLAVWLAIWL